MPAIHFMIAGMARSYKNEPLRRWRPGKNSDAYSTLPNDGSLE
jgi:hypothetical protein